MNPDTGRIHTNVSDDDAKARGLVHIPEHVRKRSREERVKWSRRKGYATGAQHALAPLPGETEADRRKRKNAAKRARRARS